MAVLNVEMYTVIKHIKSERVALLMWQSANTTFFCYLFALCCAGRLLASFRSGFSHLVPERTSEVYVKKTKAPETSTAWRDATQTQDNFCFSGAGVTERAGWRNKTHTCCCEAKLNVALKMRNCVLHPNMLNAARLSGFAGGCGGAVWREVRECDVFIGLLLSDCLIGLPAHCLCQLLFKGISLQVQLRRESLVPWTWFFFYLVFICHVCRLLLWGRVPTVGFFKPKR